MQRSIARSGHSRNCGQRLPHWHSSARRLPRELPARELVPGDVVLLRVGDVVPADLRFIKSDALTIDRSILTGESLPEEASATPDREDEALADRRSMAYSGTSVVLGRGEGIVVATGQRTELGRSPAALARPIEVAHRFNASSTASSGFCSSWLLVSSR